MVWGLWGVAALIIFVAVWVVWLRAWLYCKEWAWTKKFFRAIEPIEITLWKKSETILWGRFQQLLGLLLAVLAWIGAIDLSPFLTFIPEKWRPVVAAIPAIALAVNGLLTELMRWATTKPVEVVAVPEFKPVPPEVRAVVEQADEVKREAVAVVKEAKAEGKL